MIKTVRAIVRNGGVDLLEPLNLPEGTRLLVTVLADEEKEFWLQASGEALDKVWGNTEDDVYAELLKE
jgi:predicted DNA-binding antitoxin AbrB/MazE fold protein